MKRARSAAAREFRGGSLLRVHRAVPAPAQMGSGVLNVLTATTTLADERRARLNAMLRAVIAGYVDAFTLLKLKVFTSFMSGNTTSTGMQASEGRMGEAFRDLLPIPCFVFGAVLGALIQKERTEWSNLRVTGVVAVLLVAGMVGLLAQAPKTLVVVLLTMAMGMLSTMATEVAGQPLNSAYVTGDLKSLAEHLVHALYGRPVEDRQGEWDTHLRRAILLGGVWIALLAGGMLGAGIGTRIGAWALMVPAVGLIVVALVEVRSNREARPQANT